MTEELGILALIVVVLGVITLPFFNFQASKIDQSAASADLSEFVDSQLDANCRGSGTGGWTLRPYTPDFDSSIDTIRIDASGEFNATLRGGAGYVTKEYTVCSSIEICQWGDDSTAANPESCSTGGEIRVAAKDFSPDLNIFYNTNTDEIIIDPVE